ncbi:MAG TPA: prepilin-type N-terminal cleavage/methylation domain-containing protein [Burkholderiales bacterium]|nr:prepilin-type N-terminal cleavage/methylation domain-containing protein [Burkholderiales bacterium]
MHTVRAAPPLYGRSRERIAGFTILELAITLAIMAVLAVGVLVPFIAQVTQRRIAETERILEQAKETLMGFAAATGRLPCPALPDTDGFEKFAAGGTVANGSCATFYGFLPAATLGFTPVDNQGYAIDAWTTTQNRIRYAVSNQTVNGVTNPFTKTNGMRDATATQLAGATFLVVCSAGTGAVPATPACASAASTLTINAPAVIWSNGANAATGGRSADEAENPHPNPDTGAFAQYGTADRVFVSRTIRSVSGAEFDDIVTWLSVGNLVSRMVLAGQLP